MTSHGRILVIEDDVLLSMDLEAILTESGFEVCAVTSLDDALRMVADCKADGAVIDINLKGTMSFPAADALSDAGVPFLVLTGHSREVLPPRHRACAFLQKPYKAAHLVQAVNGMIAKAAEGRSHAAAMPKSA
jgi:DNA-binding NtrC family response regulator